MFRLKPYEYYAEQPVSGRGIQNPNTAYVRVRASSRNPPERLDEAIVGLKHFTRQIFFGNPSFTPSSAYGMEVCRIADEIIPEANSLRACTHTVELGVRRDFEFYVYHKFPVRFAIPGSDRLMNVVALSGSIALALRSLPQPATLKFSANEQERDLLAYKYSKDCVSALFAEWVSQRGLKESLSALTLKNG